MNTYFRNILPILIFVCMMPVGVHAADADEKVGWYAHEEGIRLAKETGKKVYIFFSTEDCTWCHRMITTTFQDNSVTAQLNREFIPVRVDRRKQHQIASRYYPGPEVPYSWFLAENGEEIGRLLGYIPPEKMLQVLRYISTDSYLEMTFEDFNRRLE